MKPQYSAYDPETIQILKSVLDTTWASLLPDEQDKTTKSALASRLLKAAANGERDPVRLRSRALIGVVET
jgi:hypothetical protein